MKSKTTGAIVVLIAFLAALVIISWILVGTIKGKTQVVRIDSYPRHAHVSSEAYTAPGAATEPSMEEGDAAP